MEKEAPSVLGIHRQPSEPSEQRRLGRAGVASLYTIRGTITRLNRATGIPCSNVAPDPSVWSTECAKPLTAKPLYEEPGTELAVAAPAGVGTALYD